MAQLFRVASPDAQHLIEAAGGRGALDEWAFVRAADLHRCRFGVSDRLWASAKGCLGPYGAAAAVLVGDANRLNPSNPVRSLPSWLAGICRKRRQGERIDLAVSVRAALKRGPVLTRHGGAVIDASGHVASARNAGNRVQALGRLESAMRRLPGRR